MNPDDVDAVIHQLKYPRQTIDYLSKLGLYFIRSLQNRSLQHLGKCLDLQAFAEDELVRKEYKEMHCEMPGVPRSTFLMVFSPDGTKVASTHGNHNIYITDLRTGKNLKTLIGHPRTPWCIAFHPSYNDIIASGCLGGQVRIWDLDGGSEIWTAENETVIASIAFHPIDRMLVIATFNELHFWDWSKPKPFACIATSNPKEKVRYVEFDKIGHKLITGITNVPHSRWDRTRSNSSSRVERGRFPLTPPSPPDRSANQYRPRVVPRTVSAYSSFVYPPTTASSGANGDRIPLSSVPERERRITACYQNLLHEYELLVHRYLQIYSPPTMMDRGTDPMERDQSTPGPSSSTATSGNSNVGDSNIASTSKATPSTSTCSAADRQRRTKNFQKTIDQFVARFNKLKDRYVRENAKSSSQNTSRRQLLLSTSEDQPGNNDLSEPTTSNVSIPKNNRDGKVGFKMRIKCLPKQAGNGLTNSAKDKKPISLRIDIPKPSTSGGATNSNTSNSNCSSSSNPQKRIHPGFTKTKKINKKPILDASSDDSSSDNEPFDVALKKLVVQLRKGTSEAVSSANNSQDNTVSDQNHMVETEICLPNFIATGANGAPVCAECSTAKEISASASDSLRVLPSTQTMSSVSTNTDAGDCPINTQSNVAFLPSTSNLSLYDQLEQEYNLQSDVRGLFPAERNSSINLSQDEVINYAERSNSEEDLLEQPISNFHPFDPPPEFPSINPENIGIGNMYSNIVQDLESSLNNVRNARASTRPGETSDMLSSFSDRLESIMQQSDTILRNLSHSMEMLPTNPDQADNAVERSSVGSPISLVLGSLDSESPNVVEDIESRLLSQIDQYNDFTAYRTPPPQWSPHSNDLSPTIVVENNPRIDNFYVRDRNQSHRTANLPDDSDGTNPRELLNNRSAVASDHTYHADSPRLFPQQSDNLTPLMTSLHLTISHIRRQARLLRRQVDSIERIDRAMLEVAQLQSVRQMFGELRRHISNLAGEHRSTGVSSVRQMMAGTRISDSGPGDSSIEHGSSSSLNIDSPSNDSDTQPSSRHSSGRKQLPPSRLLHIQRQNRRFAIVNMSPRRCNSRNRYARQRLYLRSFSIRQRLSDLSDHFGNTVTTNTLAVMIRRLETHLTTQMNAVGYPVMEPVDTPTNFANDIGEIAINERLRLSRIRMNRIINSNAPTEAEITSCVTSDGASRFTARNTLSRILETLTLYLSQNNYRTISQSINAQIRNVVDLTSLLSDVLLLHIVDSIPSPAGLNLNAERETLTSSIDGSCNRILQRKVFSQSQALTRSLQLMRIRTRYAAHTLDQMCNSRFTSMFSDSFASRREFLTQVHNTIRHVRQRTMSNDAPSNHGDSTNRPFVLTSSSWNPTAARTIYGRVSDSNSSGTARTFSNSDDENDSWYSNDPRRSLYRTANVNLVNADDPLPSNSNQNRLWNVPAVQVNDVPVSESFGTWQNRTSQHRYRLSDLRSNPMVNFFRPRFLHPLYAGGPLFDSNDMEDRRQDQLNDSETVMTFTPNHRIQAWDVSSGEIPDISNSTKNIVVNECKIHNDASVDLSTDGTLLVTLLPSGGYLNVTNRLGVYSLRWESLGQILYITSFEQNVVSVSLSPLSRHLVVGLASRRVSIIPNEKWTMARIFLLSPTDFPYGGRLPVLRELEQNRDTSYMSLNCIRWLPVSGQGLIIATNTGQLRILS